MAVKATIITQNIILTGADLYSIDLFHTADDPMYWSLYAFLESGDRFLIKIFDNHADAEQAYAKIADAFADEKRHVSEWIIDYRSL